MSAEFNLHQWVQGGYWTNWDDMDIVLDLVQEQGRLEHLLWVFQDEVEACMDACECTGWGNICSPCAVANRYRAAQRKVSDRLLQERAVDAR